MSEMKWPSSGDNRRSLDHIPEFPSIPRPRVRVKDIHDLGIYSCHQGSILLIQALNHYMRQQWDVFRACHEGEGGGFETRSIGRRCRPSNGLPAVGWSPPTTSHLQTARYGPRAAHAQRFKDAQQNRLHGSRHLAKLIQK